MLAVIMGKYTAIYKIDINAKKLEMLQKIETTTCPDPESVSNCLKWSHDNAGLVIGNEDRSIRLYKVTAPNDFKSPMQMTLEFPNAHSESINCVYLSPSKRLLVSSGDDFRANVFDLSTKQKIISLTFRDKAYLNARGEKDDSNFSIKGCLISNDGQFVHMLACKYRYKSFVVSYRITPLTATEILFTPHAVLEVHE